MTKSIFITGATGFLGSEIIEQLLINTNHTIYALVRAKNKEDAIFRLKRNYHDSCTLLQQINSRIIPVVGDFTKPDLGLDKDIYATLIDEIQQIYHVGAEVNLQKDASLLETTNIEGTKQIIQFAKNLKKCEKLIYVSTAFVAGTKEGIVYENDPISNHFSTIYEKTKAQAESLIIQSNLPYMIFRPSMIIGHSKTGRIKNFNTIYYVLKLILTNKLNFLPVSKDKKLDIVLVDYVANSLVKIVEKATENNTVYHLTCPIEKQPTIQQLLDLLKVYTKEALDFQLPTIYCCKVPFLKSIGLKYNQKEANRKKTFFTNLFALMPYFYQDIQFDCSNTRAYITEEYPDVSSYFNILLDYACKKNFMHQSERNIFEQAMVRRNSNTFPIHYYNILSDKIISYSGKEINEKIMHLQSVLYSWGIRPKDKIALTGINSVEYMILDQALGLLGVTTVPIYYTAPIEEVTLLLQKSNAKWFFIGDQRMMKDIDLLNNNCKFVSFSNGDLVKSNNVMTWEAFNAIKIQEVPDLYVDYHDLATIRYTSGTTGEPKGVMFNFYQLGWMGEVLTNLLSWQERNKKMKYLSFLPQSHVVEGILASYCPYYMLADIDYYYLNEFNALVDTLPKINPTVFFSVPRFYEKVWDQLASNKFGKIYLNMEEGLSKKLLGKLLKKIILKKAGLSKCKQLIVGSAPMSEKLLNDFRKLGIEIYNAYGQTEAPLITINRIKDNVIPSIGTPLPETTVTKNEDGELIVKGPQVCLGYYGLETDTIQNGILKTGDLGTIDASGHIFLQGRKKEMIITSYGKNINIPKIEERLKNIQGVSEAVLIGENRPYCTALLWLEHPIDTLQTSIDQMNADLSHPETIRKYTIIDTPLSIKAGELTPNLKVKRKNVEAHYQNEIEKMYERSTNQ